MMRLYTYFRSSAAFRVRIALALKGLPHESIPIHLTRDGGEHRKADYAAVNPQQRVPALAVDEGLLTQSMAIIEYLDEVHPQPPLLPKTAFARAKIRAAANIIACDIHPLNNSGTLAYLRGHFGADEAAIAQWYARWVQDGFAALEQMVEGGPYCFGADITLADICLVPQIYNARRFNVDLSAFPRLTAMDSHCAVTLFLAGLLWFKNRATALAA